MNSKNQNFKRIAQNRQSKIIDMISKLHNLNNKSFYEYTKKDIDDLFDPIINELVKEKENFMNQEDIKEIVKHKLEEHGFNVIKSNKYTFEITKEGNTKFIKVVNTKGKYAKWNLNITDEESVDGLFYILVRKDNEYKFHVVSSKDISNYIREYHKKFILKNGENKATDTLRNFLDKPSIHIPNKRENEYLDNWNILKK